MTSIVKRSGNSFPKYLMKKIKFPFIAPIIFLLGFIVLFLGAKKFSSQLAREKGCSCSKMETATGDFYPNEEIAYFEGQKIIPFLAQLPELESRVMGAASEDKWIEVNLSKQKLTAWEGNKIFFETPISSGKWYPTPTGEFNIWSKFKYTKMEGGNPGTNTYYYLPNVPYTMYFHQGFGLHGTYWHNNFGQPMSHGCVNLPTVAAEKLFYWTGPSLPFGKNAVSATKDNPGTRVIVHK